MDRGRDSAYTVHEIGAAELIYRHDWRITQETTEIYGVAYLHSHYRDDAHGCGLLVHHTNGSLIGYDARNGGGWSVARDGYHIQTY